MRHIARRLGQHIVPAAAILAGLNWVAHGIWSALVLDRGPLVREVLSPRPGAIALRLFAAAALLALALLARVLVREAGETAAQLREERRRSRLVTQAGSLWMWETDADGRYAYAGPAVEGILGYAPDEVVGRHFWDLFHPSDREELKASALALVAARDPFREFVNRVVTKDGNTVWLSTSAIPVEDGNGATIGYQGMNRDITDRVLAEERYRYQSFHDGLTGLLNRACFEEEMLRFNGSLSEWTPFNVMVIDVDGLKIVNDTFGHKAGDELLRSVAGVLSSPLRHNDIVARIGGDEFCIILPKVDYGIAQTKKEEILRGVERYNAQRPSIPMSLSVGTATSAGLEEETVYDIYRRADDEMYRSRQAQKKSKKSKIIDLLLAASSDRDFVSEGRVDRMSATARMVANRMRLDDQARDNLFLLARVHDLGMIGVPDELLFKPGKLTEDEYETMQMHTRIGHNIASKSKELSRIADLILHHHEWWDGTGYPEGLRGEQIPLECRILSVLDAYDAMVTSRPYSNKVTKEEAVSELKRCSGTQFDPRLVDRFVEAIS
jgi:diguanylate cyclase (GGDEF)-like protein/PAS domain S-box-containing protein